MYSIEPDAQLGCPIVQCPGLAVVRLPITIVAYVIQTPDYAFLVILDPFAAFDPSYLGSKVRKGDFRRTCTGDRTGCLYVFSFARRTADYLLWNQMATTQG